MSVLKLSKNDIIRNDDKEEKIKLKSSDISYDSAMISGWEQTNKQALDAISEYNNRINNNEWLSKEDRANYRSALDTYIDTTNRLRGLNRSLDGYSLEQERNWLRSINKGYDDINRFYDQFASDLEYDSWYKSMKADEEYQKYFEGIDANKATQGWSKYLADEQAANNVLKHDLNSDGKEAWWEKALGYLAGDGGGVVDTTLPNAEVTQTVHDLRADESYRRPNDDWTQEQKDAFGQLYAVNPNLAFDFAEETNKRNNKKKEEDALKAIAESATANGWAGAGHTLGAIATAPFGLADFMSDLAMGNAGRDIAPDGNVSPFEYSQAVTSGITEHLNTQYGTLDEDLWLIGGKGLGDAYAWGSSTLQSVVSAYTLGPGGMFASYFGQSATSGFHEKLSQGWSEPAALVYGFAVGIIDGVWEAIGGERMLRLGSAETAKNFVRQFAGQAAAEGLEGGLSSLGSKVAEDVIDRIYRDGFTTYDQLVHEYIASGMSESEAKKKAWGDMAEEVLFDAASEGLAGGVGGSVQIGLQNVASNKFATKHGQTIINRGGEASVDALKGLAHEMSNSKSALDADVISKLTNKVEKNASAKNVGKLSMQLEQTITGQNRADMESALIEKGLTKKEARLAAEYIVDGELTAEQESKIENSDHFQKAIDAVLGDSNTNVNTNSLKLHEARLGKSITIPTDSSLVAEAKPSVTENTPASENAVEGDSKRSVAKATMTDSEGNEVEVKPQRFVSTESGEMGIEIEDGKVVNAADVDFGDSDMGLVRQAAVDMSARVGGFSVDTANVFVSGYNEGQGQSAGSYINGWISAYKFGTQNSPVSVLQSNEVTSQLTKEQRESAYNFGRAFGNEAVTKEKAAGVENATTTKNKKGRVIFDGATYGEHLNERQKASLKALNFLAKALGIDIYVEELTSGDNGWYDPKDRSIHVDLNAGALKESLLLFTTSHELTHDIRATLPEKFNTLADAVFEEYNKRFGEHTMADLIDAKIEFLKEKGDITEDMTEEEAYDLAYEEVICDCLETMLVDSDAMTALSKNIYAKDKTLWQRIRDFFTGLVERIRAAYADVVPDSEEGQRFRDLGEGAERIKKLWTEAIVELSEADKTTGEGKVKHSYSSIAYSFFGDDNISIKDMESGAYKKTEGYKRYVEQCLSNMRQSVEGFSEKAALKEIRNSIDGIVEVAIAMKKAGYDILDSEGGRNIRDSKKRLLFSSLEPNSDYFTSSDISTICDKRINFAEIYDEIVRREDAMGVPKNKRFFNNIDNYFVLHKILADKGLTAPCRQCYVESMRKNLDPMANAFIELMQETDPNNKANKQLYQPSGKNKGELKSNNAKIRENLLEVIEREQYDITADKLTIKMLTTADGLAQLKLQAPLIYEAFNSFYGQSKPKMPKQATPFRFGELTALLTDDKGKIKTGLIKQIMSTGGFRLQSYSDFQIQNFADVLQVIFEAGTLGLNGHAYTKVPAFLDATKGTNLKRNISIFMYKDGGQWKIDRGDSFPYELEEIYDIVNADESGNTGIIAVVQNEDMAAWIMANNNVGYFIPFHKSGVKMGVVRETIVREGGREIKGYSGIKDHTRQQTEVWANSTADHKANTKVKKGINIYEFWDFDNLDNLSQKELIEKNVKAYIDACNEAGYLPKFREYVMDNGKVLNKVLAYAKELGFVSQDATIDDISFEYSGYRIPYGYYKCLGDFGMFTPDGEASPIERLSLKDYNFKEAVKFFSDAETLRRNEILQQFENGFEREKYRNSDMTTAELAEEVQKRRNQVVDDVVSGEYKKVKKSDGARNPYDGKVLYADSEIYDYSFLVKLDPMTVKTMPPLSTVKVDGRISQAKTVELGLKNAASIGEKVADDQYAIKNVYTKRDIILGKGGLQHSLDASSIPRLRTNARLSAIGGYIVQNAVPINGLIKENKQANGTYAMACLLNDGNGFVVAIVTVDEFSSRATKFDFVEITHSINGRFLAKKEDSRSSTRELELGQKSASTTAISEISIADFLEIVNSSHQSILSNDVLEHLGETRNTSGHYANRVLFSKRASQKASYAPTFYSHMGKVIDDIKLEKMGSESLLNHLKGRGVKAEEIKWSGIETFLEGKKSVTKAELQEFVAGSQLTIEEEMSDSTKLVLEDGTVYDSVERFKDAAYSLADGQGIDRSRVEFENYDDEAYVALVDGDIDFPLLEAEINDGGARWSQYKLDGGENYRELVFKMPNSTYSNRAMRGHWGQDAEGILVHARIQDFTVDGKKMLFIEELQSDWHNEGREKGYTTPEYEDAVAVYDKLADEYGKVRQAFNKYVRSSEFNHDPEDVRKKKFDWLRNKMDTAEKRMQAAERDVEALKKKGMGDVADAPFKDNYHEYVLKRLLRMATEEGYDSIGWTPAWIQSERWSEDYAEAYRIEYDQDIPKFLRKYGKKWGTTVGKAEITQAEHTVNGEHYDAETIEVWSMDITDSMKDSVLYEGQALYQHRNSDAMKPRTLLANALETVAQNDIERNKLKEYKSKISLIEAEQVKLSELRAKIKELSFAPGQRETESIKKLQFEANQTANRINTYDRQLLNLESTKALKGVLEREKEMARKRAEQKAEQRRKADIARVKERAAKTERELMNRYQESREKAREGREKTDMRHKIKDIVKELNTLLLNPTAKKHIKEELRKEVADALSAINMDTIDADARVAKYNALIARESDPDIIAELTKTRDNIQLQGEKLHDKLVALQSAYEKIEASEDIELSMSYQEVIRNSIKNVTEKVGNTPIRNMTLEQLEMVYDLFKMIRTTVRDANKSFKEKKGQTIMQMAEAVNDQVRTVGGQPYKRNTINANLQRVGWTFLKPFVAFRTIGSITLTNMYKELRNGEDTFYGDVKEAQAFIEGQKDKHGFKDWDLKKTKTFTAKSGKSFDLTLEQMMTLYAYSKRDQAHDHIIEGGIVFEDAVITEKNKWGVPIKYEVTTKDAFNLSEDTFQEICGYLENNHKDVVAFVKEMQAYLSDTMGAKGNEVSMKLLGVKLFKEKFYLPIKSSQYYMNFKAEEAGEVKLKSPAFSKETVKHANNPIVVHNFTDLWAEHINDMSMYHSFVLALEDFTRVYNYKTKTDDKVETMDTKATLETAYPGVTKYINKFLKDMNGGVRGETVGWAEKLTSLSKKGAVLGSASVTIQQPSAVMRAMAMVNPKYFVTTAHKSLNLAKHKQDWEELKKYAPIAGIKEMGRFDVGMGQGTVDWIKSDKTVFDKAEDFLSMPPAFMDEVSWVSIWNAVKRETVHNNPKLSTSSDEFLSLAGERFTEVISMSQVYDSVFSRSDLMRNKSWIAKSLTAFMAEPTTTLNMIWDAWVQGKRSGSMKGFVKANASTGGAIVASIVLNAVLKSIITAMRDDDEDESYAEKYLEHLVGEIKDNLNPLGLIPFVKDIVSIFKGYDVERMDMALFSDLQKAIDALDSDSKTLYEKWSGLIGAISAFAGVPIKNVERDVRGLITTIFGETEETTLEGMLNAIEEGWTGKEISNGQQLYEAMLNGDTEQIERLKGRFKDQSAINSAIRKALRENDPRIKEAAEALNNGNFSKYSDILNEIAGEENFAFKDIKAAILTEFDNMKESSSTN